MPTVLRRQSGTLAKFDQDFCCCCSSSSITCLGTCQFGYSVPPTSIQRSSVHHFPSVMLSFVPYNYYYLSTCLSAVDHDQFNWWWWWWRWWSQPWSFFEVNTKLLSLHFHPLVVFSSPFPSVCLLLWTESVFCCHFWLPLFPWRWCLRLSLPSSSLLFFALKDDLLGLSLAAKAAAVETNGNEQV